jgi:hypothetical protein
MQMNTSEPGGQDSEFMETLRKACDAILPMLKAANICSPTFGKNTASESLSGIVAFQERMAHLPADIQAASKILAEPGWYMDPHFPLGELRTTVITGDYGEAHQLDSKMIAYYRDLVPSIEERLTVAFPRRAMAFAQAFGPAATSLK